jgi:hypothetical protein
MAVASIPTAKDVLWALDMIEAPQEDGPACPSGRGVLSGNSKEVKAALYRDTVIFPSLEKKKYVLLIEGEPLARTSHRPESKPLERAGKNSVSRSATTPDQGRAQQGASPK